MTAEPQLTVGLEIHAELKTRTKMFCDCLNDPAEHHPNVNVCPICTGHPGTLPFINKKAVELVIKLGLALSGQLAKTTHFVRKNYFYPDLPKNYQISQYEEPLVRGGELLGVKIRRIHLEEDTGTLIHTKEASLVDYNRSGVPLLELVTEPEITSARQAADFGRELQLILRYLDISDADMEKGQMRLEANISLDMGTKVEIKNINSFKALEQAIEYEQQRQSQLLKKGKKIIQETRGWDAKKQATVSQRTKEEAQDYRYFPEPDLPPFNLLISEINRLRQEIPELPEQKRRRFSKEFNLSLSQSDILVQGRRAADFFEKAASELRELKIMNYELGTKLLFNYFTSDLWGLMVKEEITWDNLKITPEKFAHLIQLIAENQLTSRAAKDILKKMIGTGGDPHEIMKGEGLAQVSDETELKKVVEKIIAANSQAVTDYKKGKQQAMQFLIGKALSASGGKGNPQVLRQLFEQLLR